MSHLLSRFLRIGCLSGPVALAFFVCPAGCGKRTGSGASSPTHEASAFIEGFRFTPLPVMEDSDEIAVPWVMDSAPGSSGGIIAPLERDPEREFRVLFSKVAQGEPDDLETFWDMIFSSIPPTDGGPVKWERHLETPHFAYGSYSAGQERVGRIWISLADNNDFTKVELHLRMVEQSHANE